MIDRYSFLDTEELAEQRGRIKKVSKAMRGKRGGAGGVRDRERARRRSGRERREGEMTLVVPLEGRIE